MTCDPPTIRDPKAQKLGFVFAGLNIGLDLLVLVIILKAGVWCFASRTVIAGYPLPFFVTRTVGRVIAES